MYRHRISPLFLSLFVTIILSFLLAATTRGGDKSLPRGYFNKQFNTLIRSSHPAWWGNWNLSPTIEVGAVGIIDTNTGSFKPAGLVLELDKLLITKTPLSESLQLSKGNVKKSEFSAAVNASTPVASAEGNISWKFNSQGAIFAHWQLVEHHYLMAPVDAIDKNMDVLRHTANNNNMLSPHGGIAQSFGVITGVIFAKSGLSIGAISKNAEFQITADEHILQSYLSADKVHQGYYQTKIDGQISSFIWPADPATKVDPAPVAFTFASIDDRRVLPNWIRPVTSFSINVNNHGSYFIDMELKYIEGGNNRVFTDSVTGFSSINFHNIPLEATDIELTIDFFELFHEGKKTLHWTAPLGTWVNGWRHIDLYGFWPGKTAIKIREELEDNGF